MEAEVEFDEVDILDGLSEDWVERKVLLCILISPRIRNIVLVESTCSNPPLNRKKVLYKCWSRFPSEY
jgi:hypothetical protein